MAIQKNDNVRIMKGEFKGLSGKVIKVFPIKNQAIVEGRNLAKRHTKPSQKDPKGGIQEKEAPISISNLLLVCPKCNEPSRTGIKRLEDKRKMRICKRCGEMIE